MAGPAARESLFTLLSRQPWWVSILVGMALFAIAQWIFPPVAPFVALPFFALALYFGWKQFGGLSHEQTAERLGAVRAMAWEEFAGLVTAAYRKRGYEVEATRSSAFDFRLKQQGRITLVQCRRWKVNQVGVGPLKELYEALDIQEAYNGVCLAAGGFSDAARQFAAGKPLSLLEGAELAKLLGRLPKR
jgi:restriction system protein